MTKAPTYNQMLEIASVLPMPGVTETIRGQERGSALLC